MRVGVLTGSRSDYGIYRPLLRKLQADPFFELKLLVFGTHLSIDHGYTYNQVLQDGFTAYQTFQTVPASDQPGDISSSMGDTIIKFASFWSDHLQEFDIVFCMGDRFEMFAAASSTVPFNIPLAHIHGGETTMGAIDNVFRHSITHMSTYHFVALEEYLSKVRNLKGGDEHIYNVGALSLDNLHDTQLMSTTQFYEQYKIDLNQPTILLTFHPETINFKNNHQYIAELLKALKIINKEYALVITMPNNDTSGSVIRENLKGFAIGNPKVHLVENFGTAGYFSCLQNVSFVMGNSSSGIIEAASFGKYVIDLGNRQKGRVVGKNVLHCPIQSERIVECAASLKSLPSLSKDNIYGDGNSSGKIIKILKSLQIQ